LKVPEVPVISSRKSKKDRQYNGQKKKDKGTINDLQNTTHKTKDWAQKGWQDQLEGLPFGHKYSDDFSYVLCDACSD
jgi:hypothetical protein